MIDSQAHTTGVLETADHSAGPSPHPILTQMTPTVRLVLGIRLCLLSSSQGVEGLILDDDTRSWFWCLDICNARICLICSLAL